MLLFDKILNMKALTNQYNFRIENELKIISLLQTGEKSINYLKDHMSISFTAISNILDELVMYGLVKRIEKKPIDKKRGRIPVLVRLDLTKGVTCAIDLSASDILITLNDLEGHVIIQNNLTNISFIEDHHLPLIAKEIKDMLESDVVNGRQLLSICIASPGLINKTNGEIYRSFRVKASNKSLVNFFFNEFGVLTNLYNDIKLSCLGEMVRGFIPQDAKNFLYVHIGNNVGAAIVIDRKIYQGKDGFTGEFSNFNNFTNNNSLSKNRLYGLNQICHKAHEYDNNLNLLAHDFKIDYDRIKEEYSNGNPSLLTAIDDIARLNALQLIAYNDFLDFEYIIIEGPILLVKEHFKTSLLKHIKELDEAEFRAKIIFSSSNGSSSLLGTIYQANSTYFLAKLEELTNSRSTKTTYNINEFFGDVI